MSLLKFGPRLGSPRKLQLTRPSRPTPAFAIYRAADGDIAGIQTVDGWGGRIASTYYINFGYLSPGRYFCQLKNDTKQVLSTVIVTTGLAALPAAMAANATMNSYIFLRLSGTFALTDTLTPGIGDRRALSGGRG